MTIAYLFMNELQTWPFYIPFFKLNSYEFVKLLILHVGITIEDIGAGHFIGVSGSAAAAGLAVGHFEFNVSRIHASASRDKILHRQFCVYYCWVGYSSRYIWPPVYRRCPSFCDVAFLAAESELTSPCFRSYCTYSQKFRLTFSLDRYLSHWRYLR